MIIHKYIPKGSKARGVFTNVSSPSNNLTINEVLMENNNLISDNNSCSVLLVCIARQENRYILEFVDYYKKLGVDKIIICDNNHDGEETFDQVLRYHINSGFVTIENYRNQTSCQVAAYNDVFNRYKDEYDWIMFFDCDEFLTIQPVNNVKEYLSEEKFQPFDVVLVNWMIYDDNDLLIDDGRGVLERFTRPCNYDFKCDFSFPENNHVKSIVHSKIFKPEKLFGGAGVMHCPSQSKNRCNDKGETLGNVSPFYPYDFTRAYLRHYRYKTIGEFIDKKFLIQTPDKPATEKNQIYLIKCFFKTNKSTRKKVDMMNNAIKAILPQISPIKETSQTNTSTTSDFKAEEIYGKALDNVYIVKHENKTPKTDLICVYGTLDTKLGKEIRNEMFEWLTKYYTIIEVIQKEPGTLYEYPALRFAQWYSLKNNVPILYLHTKGSANTNPAAMQDYVRRMWKDEFTNHLSEYASMIEKKEGDVVCPFTGPDKATWFNGFIATSKAFSYLPLIEPQEDRYIFEHLFKNTRATVKGRLLDNVFHKKDSEKYVNTMVGPDFDPQTDLPATPEKFDEITKLSQYLREHYKK